MTAEYDELKDLYFTDFDSLTIEQLNKFTEYIKADYDNEFRESRLKKIVLRLRQLSVVDMVKNAEEEHHAYLVKCSEELKAITNKWESNGVVKESSEWRDVWKQDGCIIFEMRGAVSKSGKPVYEYLEDAKKVDAELFS